MKFKVIHTAMNGGGLMLKRFFFGFAFKYRAHNNLKYAVEDKLNKLHDDLVKEFEKLRELEAEENRIKKKIRGSREADEGETTPELMKLPLFPLRHKTKPQPDQRWRKFEHILRSGGKGGSSSIAGEFGGSSGRRIIEVDGGVMDEDANGIVNCEVVGEQAFPIVRPGNQNRNKQKQNQNQQNN